MQENKLTPTQIASMSEVVAKYMGWCTYIEYDGRCILEDYIYDSWEVIHFVWEKIRYENVPINNDIEYSLHLDKIQEFIIENKKEQCFVALFETIKFINQLKV